MANKKQNEYTMLRYKVLLFLLVVCCSKSIAQELFVYSDPASNMPSKSIGFRATNWMMQEIKTNNINYHLIPEVMIGINHKLMFHAEAFLSNRDKSFVAEGGGAYLKYRFLSRDNVYRHFRMAAYSRISYNNSEVHQEELSTFGHNSGYQLGMIATKLLHKTALSANCYYEQAINNKSDADYSRPLTQYAYNYMLSAGRLMLPKAYNSYKQTNINIMLELIGQIAPERNLHYVDIAPSIQFIFNSQTRLDIAWRKELYSNMYRTAPNGILLRVEHLVFNALKR